MPAELARLLVGAQHHGERVPADSRADAVLDLAVPGMRVLLMRRDGVDVGRVGRERQPGTLSPGHFHRLAEQEVGPLAALERHDRADGLDPLARFRRARRCL